LEYLGRVVLLKAGGFFMKKPRRLLVQICRYFLVQNKSNRGSLKCEVLGLKGRAIKIVLKEII